MGHGEDGEDDKDRLTGWERLGAGLFAATVMQGEYNLPRAPTLILHAAGWLVILAALGVVELAMALYYGYRHRRLRAEE